MSFLNKDYNVPASGSNYMKLEKGDNTFRVLSSAIVGWELWTSEIVEGKELRKPNRFRDEESIPMAMIDPENMPKHFWAFIAWNYQEQKIQILELTQRSVQKAIKAYVDKKEWGDPKNYDITVNKSGEGMETRYAVTVNPPKEFDKDIIAQVEAMNINLEALYDGGDPFNQDGISMTDNPFKE
jgi:hypothetical protein